MTLSNEKIAVIAAVVVIMALIYWCISKDFGTYLSS